MDKSSYLAHIRADGERFTQAVASGIEAQCEHCPDWNLHGLAVHVAGVCRFMTAIVEAGPADGPPKLEAEAAPEGAAVVEYVRGKLEALLATLERTDPAAAVWTWTPRTDAGYFFRRLAHELAVHRWDAENAVGEASPIDADLAADGIDEVIQVGMQFSIRGPRSNFPAGSLHLHRTDGDGEWMLSATDGTLTVTNEHGKGDAAVRGAASDLLLYLWGRGQRDLEIFGDQAVADAWATAAP